MQASSKQQRSAAIELSGQIAALRNEQRRLTALDSTAAANLLQLRSLAEDDGRRRDETESRQRSMSSAILATLVVLMLGLLGAFAALDRRVRRMLQYLVEFRATTSTDREALNEQLVGLALSVESPTQNPLPLASAGEPVAVQSPQDHRFALCVGEELHRMKRRLAALPDGTVGLNPLRRSVERVEEAFANEGYELQDLVNTTYRDGMNVKAQFIPSENLAIGQRIITSVIKPPIFYKGELLGVPEIEVSTGG